jgi:ATP-dependent protease ClpP protease subunit
MSGEEAREYGLVDEVIRGAKKNPDHQGGN